MAQKATKKEESVAIMRLEMVEAGAYFWLRAEDGDENLVSALNRLKYGRIAARFDALNIPKPLPEEMYAYAREKWPAHKLHAFLHGEAFERPQ